METRIWEFKTFDEAFEWIKEHLDWKGKLIDSRLGLTRELAPFMYRVKHPDRFSFVVSKSPPPNHRTYKALWKDQITNICSQFHDDLTTRQAIISIGWTSAKPCWCLIQFLYRDHRLHMIVYSRSQNIAMLPYDFKVFCDILSSIPFNPGTFTHIIGSLHEYVKK